MPSTTRARVDAGNLLELARQRVEVARRVQADLGVGADRLLQRVGRVEREQPAVVDDRDPLAQLVGFLHVVRREHDRLAPFVQLADHVPQREAALRVEARGRLVEEQHVGVVHDRPRHHQPLRHAARQLVDVRRGPVREPELLEQLARPCVRVARAHAEVAAVEVQVLGDVERAVERVGLRHDADDLLGRRGPGDHVDAADDRRALGRDDPGRQHPDGRRLARAVRAEQAEDLAPADAQVEVLDGPERPAPAVEDLGQTLGDDDVVVGCRLVSVGWRRPPWLTSGGDR